MTAESPHSMKLERGIVSVCPPLHTCSRKSELQEDIVLDEVRNRSIDDADVRFGNLQPDILNNVLNLLLEQAHGQPFGRGLTRDALVSSKFSSSQTTHRSSPDTSGPLKRFAPRRRFSLHRDRRLVACTQYQLHKIDLALHAGRDGDATRWPLVNLTVSFRVRLHLPPALPILQRRRPRPFRSQQCGGHRSREANRCRHYILDSRLP